jgi:hypothetical protein
MGMDARIQTPKGCSHEYATAKSNVIDWSHWIPDGWSILECYSQIHYEWMSGTD